MYDYSIYYQYGQVNCEPYSGVVDEWCSACLAECVWHQVIPRTPLSVTWPESSPVSVRLWGVLYHNLFTKPRSHPVDRDIKHLKF